MSAISVKKRKNTNDSKTLLITPPNISAILYQAFTTRLVSGKEIKEMIPRAILMKINPFHCVNQYNAENPNSITATVSQTFDLFNTTFIKT